MSARKRSAAAAGLGSPSSDAAAPARRQDPSLGPFGSAPDPLAAAYMRDKIAQSVADDTEDKASKAAWAAFAALDEEEQQKKLNDTVRFCMLTYMCVGSWAARGCTRGARLFR